MLSDLQTKKLTRYFQVYDIDDDGQIEASDFERIVENVQLLHGGGREADPLRAAYMSRWERLRAAADSDGAAEAGCRDDAAEAWRRPARGRRS